MFCKYCGKQLEDEALICPGCGRLMRLSVPAAPVSVPVQAVKKRTKMSKGTIVALVAFFLFLFGTVLNTIVTTSNTIDQLTGEGVGYEIGQIGLLVVAGIFSILTLVAAVISLVISIGERVSASGKIFPVCMTAVGLAYVIDFICAAVMFAVMNV